MKIYQIFIPIQQLVLNKKNIIILVLFFFSQSIFAQQDSNMFEKRLADNFSGIFIEYNNNYLFKGEGYDISVYTRKKEKNKIYNYSNTYQGSFFSTPTENLLGTDYHEFSQTFENKTNIYSLQRVRKDSNYTITSSAYHVVKEKEITTINFSKQGIIDTNFQKAFIAYFCAMAFLKIY